MPEAPLVVDAERDRVVEAVAAFCAPLEGDPNFLGVDHAVVTDRTASDRWAIRFRGVERSVIAIWLTLGQRTVLAECEVMPAPEEGLEAVYAIALRRNSSLLGLSYALGPERGVYLVTRIPARDLDAAELDRLCGAIVTEVEEVYPTMMSLGYPHHYRRRRRA